MRHSEVALIPLALKYHFWPYLGMPPDREPAKEPKGKPSQVRFRPDGMKSHRQKLGLSAKDYGLLVGASALSVYKWEEGKVKPRAKALPRIIAVRTLDKREALVRLEQLHSAV